MTTTTTEWRLAAIAVIAAVYTIAWRGIAMQPPRSAPPAITATPRASTPVPVHHTRPLRVRTRSS